jgi:hypothetical protein
LWSRGCWRPIEAHRLSNDLAAERPVTDITQAHEAVVNMTRRPMTWGIGGDCALFYAHAGRWPSTHLIGHLMKRILLFLVASVSAPSISANAQADDKAYCAQLSAFYRKYVQNTSRRVDVEALAAVDDCQKGNAATAIPVLEDRLRRGGFSLPKGFTP